MNTQLSSLLKSSEAEGFDEGKQQDGTARPKSRDWRARFASALPWLLILGFLGVLGFVFGDRIVPARELDMSTVVTVRQNADTVSAPVETGANSEPMNFSDAPMLFQASGWIEPDPFPTIATALIDGVVETVEILEGDKVEKGQLLAKLIDEDARLELETAKSQKTTLETQAIAHRFQIDIVEAEIASLQKQVSAEEARQEEAKDLYERLKRLGSSSVAEREITQAKLKLVTVTSDLEALAVTEAELQAKIEQLHKVCDTFDAQIAEAEINVAKKQLAFDRTRIKSPITGRVLDLHVRPGQKRMLGSDNLDSATVARLYDPESLQARIDVPLAEAAKLTVGQPVGVRSELLPGVTFRGEVTRIVGEADLQRNTLQAKVAIENPDDRLRPEMLCRAEFLASPNTQDLEASSTVEPSGRVQVFVPEAALVGDSENEATVWRVDVSGDHVAKQTVTLGNDRREDHRLVLEGLKPGDRVVLNPPADLSADQRIRPTDS